MMIPLELAAQRTCLNTHCPHRLLPSPSPWPPPPPRRFDPDGQYVKRWLPVLSQLPAEYVHHPWRAPPEVLEEAGGNRGSHGHGHPRGRGSQEGVPNFETHAHFVGMGLMQCQEPMGQNPGPKT